MIDDGMRRAERLRRPRKDGARRHDHAGRGILIEAEAAHGWPLCRVDNGASRCDFTEWSLCGLAIAEARRFNKPRAEIEGIIRAVLAQQAAELAAAAKHERARPKSTTGLTAN